MNTREITAYLVTVVYENARKERREVVELCWLDPARAQACVDAHTKLPEQDCSVTITVRALRTIR